MFIAGAISGLRLVMTSSPTWPRRSPQTGRRGGSRWWCRSSSCGRGWARSPPCCSSCREPCSAGPLISGAWRLFWRVVNLKGESTRVATLWLAQTRVCNIQSKVPQGRTFRFSTFFLLQTEQFRNSVVTHRWIDINCSSWHIIEKSIKWLKSIQIKRKKLPRY